MIQLLLYNTGIAVYNIVLHLASVFNAKAALFVKGRKGIFKQITAALEQEQRPRIWMHCASLGEFEQGRPVMEAIKKQYPGYCLILTFFSPSGYEVKKNYDAADHVFYLPLDTPSNARLFIDLTKPECVLFVKYEFWFHYLHTLQSKSIPVLLISAVFQPRHPFFKWYGGLYRKMLSFYKQIFVQEDASAKLLKTIGIEDVQIAGDTRFDRAARVLELDKNFRSIETFKGDNNLIVAGSTWPDDEILLKKALKSLPDNYKLLLAPHEVDDVNISRIQSMFPNENCLWATDESAFKNARVCIVHTVGQLSYLYKYADIVWIGGGFTHSGIHNVVEPAVFGKPVFFGTNYKRYREAVEMININAAKTFTHAGDFSRFVLENKHALLQMSNNAKNYVLAQLGATKKIMSYLEEKCLSRTA